MAQQQIPTGQSIKTLTPTSAGFAQVFDVSGIQEKKAIYAAQKSAKQDKKMQELILDYDTKGAWKRDIPEIQRQVNAVNEFAMKNSEALANPAENIEVWQEFKEKQDAVKNLVTYSAGAKEQFDRGHRAYINGSNGMYLTDNNKDTLYNYAETPTAEQYADFSAFDDPMKFFDRNLDLKFQEYTDIANELWEDAPAEDTGQDIEGKSVYKNGKRLNVDGLRVALEERWNSKTLEGSSLRENYGSDKEKFVQDTIKKSADPTKYGLVADPTESGATSRTDADKKSAADAFMVVRNGSAANLTESTQRFLGGEQTGRGTKNDPYVATGRGKGSDGNFYTRESLDDVNQKRRDDAAAKGLPAPAPITFNVEKVTGADSAFVTYGPATVGEGTVSVVPTAIKKPMAGGTNITSGEVVTDSQMRFKEGQIVREVGIYKKAKNTMSVRILQDGKKTMVKFEAGQTLPNFTKMYEDGVIDKYTHSKLVANSKEFEGAVVMSIPETMNFFQLAPGDSQDQGIQNIINSGKESYIVPIEEIQVELDQFGQGKYKTDYTNVKTMMGKLRGAATTAEAKKRSNMPD